MLWFDTETYNELPIKNGTYVYTESCEVMIGTYAFDDGPVSLWDRTLDLTMPADLEYALRDDSEPITAHSTMFDRPVVKHALGIDVRRERWRDTLVRALAHSLPGGLDKLCDILEVPVELAKHKDGNKLIQLFCKPQPAWSKIRRATRFTHPAEWQQFCDYAVDDINAMREVARRLPIWNYEGFELELWHLDQKINDRGFCVDMELVHAAIRATDRAQKGLSARAKEMTNGDVERATQRDKLLMHIVASYGVLLPDLKGDTLERRINDPELPETLKELLRVRLQASTSSTSKYKSLLKGTSADGRLRGTLQYNGAMRTGRWAGRTFQPQNLPSRDLLEPDDIALGIEAMKLDCEHMLYDNVMKLGASAIRGCVIAPPGKKLVVSDLSNIEGRYAAWLAGEEWKLQAFRDYDTLLLDANGDRIPTGKKDDPWERCGPDLYKLAYAKSFRVDPSTVNKSQRQIGKVKELMLQYQGGVGAYITGAVTYGIDLDEMAHIAYEVIPGNILHEAEGFLEWCIEQKRPTFGLPAKTFIVCDSLKRLWRGIHPMFVSLWRELEDTVKAAIDSPGRTFYCRRFIIRRDGAWLRINMPSGRALCYPSPTISKDGSITYKGVNQYTKQWSRIHTYGGKLLENLTQAGAKDVMAANMPMIEDHNFDIVLTVHDEVITEAPDSITYTVVDLSTLLATVPTWAEGLPLAAGGFESYRYRKG